MLREIYDPYFDHYIGDQPLPPESARIVLNMLVGDFPEPFLPLSLESLADQVDWAVINFNGQEDSPTGSVNLAAILESRFAREERLTLSSAPFRNFSFNRNVCLELSRKAEWIIQFDPDEIPYPDLIRPLLKEVYPEVGRVGMHYWHFLKGFSQVQNAHPEGIDLIYYKPFAWRQTGDNLYWTGVVHERLIQADLADWAIPGIGWVHLGYVDPTHVFRKWVQFSEMAGRAGEYNGYFSDPRAPWRTDPSKILDDRPLHPFAGKYPPLLEPLATHERYTKLPENFVGLPGEGGPDA